MKRIAMLAGLCFALVSLARANPVPVPMFVDNSPIFIIWCALGSLLIFTGLRRIYVALSALVFGMIAIWFGVTDGLLFYWRIFLVVLLFWLACQKGGRSDRDWILKFWFTAGFVILMVILFKVEEPYYDPTYYGGHPDELRAEMRGDLIHLWLSKAGIIALVCLGAAICRKAVRLLAAPEPQPVKDPAPEQAE